MKQKDDYIKRPFKTSDIKLLKRLWPFIKPVKLYLGVAVFLVLLMALLSLALPYITKVSIDKYIVPSYKKINLIQYNEGNVELDNIIQKIYNSQEKVETSVKGIYFLPAGTKALSLDEEKLLFKNNILSERSYYVYKIKEKDKKEVEELLNKYPRETENYKNVLSIQDRNLSKLPPKTLLNLRNDDLLGLKNLAFIFLILMAFTYFCDFGQRVVLEFISQKVAFNIRQKMMQHLFILSQSFFDKQQTGRLTSRLTSDINNLNSLIKSTATTLFSDIVVIFGIFIIMFFLSPKLTLITLIFSPVLVGLSIFFGTLSRRVQRILRAKVASINQVFSEAMSGIVLIQAFRREKSNIENFEVLNKENYHAGLKQLQIHAIFTPLVDLFATLVLAIIIWYGGKSIFDNTISLGIVAAFIGYVRQFFLPIKDLAEKLNIFQSAFASLERIVDILDVDEKIEDNPNAVLPKKNGGDIEFKNISFKYTADGPWVLKDISFKIKKGESLALIGSTGSGKSSIINLMLRFYEPQKGEIYFDGLPLKELNLKAHSKRIALVTQDVYLYADSVLNNLRLGRKDLKEEEIIAAAKAVGADKFINKLENGYNEILSPGGFNLSAGERQLLACARALIEAPEIVILDEATAFVDTISEKLIENALNNLFQERTSIVIAHRLSTIQSVDRIIVLHKGVIVEEGKHLELLEKKAHYYRFAALQGLVEL